MILYAAQKISSTSVTVPNARQGKRHLYREIGVCQPIGGDISGRVKIEMEGQG